jgi:eukaryotic-like serine/threonine-protein kinase
VGERTPVGEAFVRAAALLRDHTDAPPSERILLDEATRGLLEVRFVIQRTPEGGYTLSGEELRLDASRPLLGKPTPCVGRDVELGTLEATLSECVEEGARFWVDHQTGRHVLPVAAQCRFGSQRGVWVFFGSAG